MLRALLSVFGWALKVTLERAVAKATLAAQRIEATEQLVRLLEPAVPVSRYVTRDQELDFQRWRSLTYVGPMSKGVADETALALTGANAPEPYDAATLATVCMNTPLAYLVTREGDGWLLDFGALSLFPFQAVTVSQFRFDVERSEYSITDIGGLTHRPGDATWDTALTHVMAWLTVSVPSGAHNWVHFGLPDTVSSVHERMTRRDSNVWRLLAPHVRFTNRINAQALWTQRASNNGPGFFKKFVPWVAVPFSPDQFRGGILRNTQRHYRDLPRHFDLPNQFDTRIPYLAFIQAYHRVAERFAAAIAPHLEAEAWGEFAQGVDRELPGFARVPQAKALGVLLWQLGVVHMTDHAGYYALMMKHGFMNVPPSMDKAFTRRDVSRWDRWRTRNFLRTFVNFNPAPGLDQRLLNVEAYGFAAGSPEAQAAQQFKAELIALDAELAAQGKAPVRVADMVQSVCY